MLVITNISILLINTNLANAIVICIDKYNQTNVIPCSDQNAIVRTGSQQVNMNNTFTNATTNNSTANANPRSNTTNLMSDVRVVSEQSQRTAGFIFLIHYIVFGNVANFGNGTSGPITVHLQTHRIQPIFMSIIFHHYKRLVIAIGNNASTRERGCPLRREEILLIKKLGYQRWKQMKDAGRRWIAEIVFSSIKRVVGEDLFSKKFSAQKVEVGLKIMLYNKFISL